MLKTFAGGVAVHGSRERLHEMIKRDAKKGLVSLCIGGGMGVALAIERWLRNKP